MNIVPENSKNMKGVSLEDLSQRDDYFIVDAYSWNNVYIKWFNELNFPELTAISKDENGKITSQTGVTGVFEAVSMFTNKALGDLVIIKKLITPQRPPGEDHHMDRITDQPVLPSPESYPIGYDWRADHGRIIANHAQGDDAQGDKAQGGKRLAAKKPTSKRVMIDGKNRTVYVGPKGGEYIKSKGKFVSI